MPSSSTSVHKFDADKIKFKDILEKPLKVPDYQRMYSWNQDNWDALWEDIENCRKENDYQHTFPKEPNSPHFFGCIVIQEPKNEIIDGQQRIATLLIIYAVLKELSSSFYNKNPYNCVTNFLCQKNTLGDTETVTLIMGDQDNDFFQKYIIERQGRPEDRSAEIKEYFRVNKISKSQKDSRVKICDAYNFFFETIENKLSCIPENDRKLKYIASLIDTIQFGLEVILFKVNNEEAAFMIFETLNDRGLELSIADLLKNKIFYLKQSNINQAKEQWRNIIENAEQNNVTKFIRYQFMSDVERVSEKTLFKKIKDKIDYSNVSEYLDKLENESSYFNFFLSLNMPDNWTDKTNEYISEINKLRITLTYPLLLSGAIKYSNSPREFEKVAKLARDFAFQYYIICGYKLSDFEKHISKMAIELRHNKITLPKISEYFKNQFTKQSFESSFKQLIVKFKSPLCTYIIDKLEEKAFENARRTATSPHSRGPKVTIEHIMPQKLNEEWNIDSEEHKEYLNRLGNLVKLELNLNANIKNSGFQLKKNEGYSKSDLCLAKKVSTFQRWDISSIDDYQAYQYKLAKQIWNLDL